ncbi:MAG: hypothetical protein GF398_17030 [Chitinivibrionales bacterium]|nr:hypothetical protein [Chitinivibrionales bacterium]
MNTWEPVKAAKTFISEVGQPPHGDTHHKKPYKGSLSKTKEFPGFGVIFNGAGRLDWKAGPLRGHYHGDQLSLHWWGKAVDHAVSYSPRPDQEHMHNRVAFTPDGWEYANMNGYERTIAFKASPVADAAIGQVESNRLRKQPKVPENYIWQGKWDEKDLSETLVYRRTIILVKSSKTYYVIRDQHWGPELTAAFCLHTKGSKVSWNKKDKVDFGNMALYITGSSQPSFKRFDWSNSGSGKNDPTKGVRLSIKGKRQNLSRYCGRQVQSLPVHLFPAVSKLVRMKSYLPTREQTSPVQ